jgi:hypothetical protein
MRLSYKDLNHKPCNWNVNTGIGDIPFDKTITY